MKKIAITGGIGSGKSTVGKILKEKGFPVYSCDEIYADLQTDSLYLTALKGLFPEVLTEGKLDKATLSKRVFQDKEALQKLNALAHPMILERLMQAIQKEKSETVFVEVQLLFEAGWEKYFDEILVVTRELEARIAAVQTRSKLSKEEVLSRIQNQFDYQTLNDRNEKITVMKNDGTTADLKDRVEEYLLSL